MNAEESSHIAALSLALYSRPAGETDFEVWHMALRDVPFSLALAAVERLATTSGGPEFLRVQHVRDVAKVIARERLTAAGEPTPPRDRGTYQRYITAWRQAVIAGASPADADAQARSDLQIGPAPERTVEAPVVQLVPFVPDTPPKPTLPF